MRQLVYTNYESGHSGLSNGIMSIEVGVALAFLTNRFLVLEGNLSPPANVVSYGGRVSNDQPSRVTDLLDLPVPWGEPADVEMDNGLPSRELTDRHLSEVVFYAPDSLDVTSADARAFARGRTTWLSTGEFSEVPILKLTEDPVVLEQGRKRTNLSFYSYSFYLDDETRRSLYRVLERMRPKPALAELAGRVAADLGEFNAVHLRRGDFKVTYGVTTLDRQPWEAIEAMDHHFRRDDTLVLVTDERDDPFFDEITAAYPHHVFIDHHILDEYGDTFDEMPCRDSISLAYLSQLVAAESKDFIGTMTSTFTSIIQRYRANRGREEPFKFFWNELPDPEDRLERGRHPISECVPLDRGVMIEELDGPYSWNRYSQRLAPSWMREWPESFLTEEVLATGARPGRSSTPSARYLADVGAGQVGLSRVYLPFEGVRVAIQPGSARLALKLVEGFAIRNEPALTNVFAELEVTEVGADGDTAADGSRALLVNGHQALTASTDLEMLRAIKRHLVQLLNFARPRHAWLEASAFSRDGKALVVVGDLGDEDDHLPDALCSSGWDLLWDDVIPIHPADRRVLPFARTSWPKGARARTTSEPAPLGAVVLAAQRLKTRDGIVRLSPSVAVAELLAYCLDFRHDRKRAVERLCQMVEKATVYQLSFSSAERAVGLLTDLDEWTHEPQEVNG